MKIVRSTSPIITIFTPCAYFWWIPADVRVWRVEVKASQLVLSTALIITTSSLIGTLIPYRLNQYSIIIINRYTSGFTLLIYLLWVAPIRPSWLGSSSRHRRYALHRKNSQWLPLHIKYDTLFYTQHPLLESNSNIKFVIWMICIVLLSQTNNVRRYHEDILSGWGWTISHTRKCFLLKQSYSVRPLLLGSNQACAQFQY